MNTADLRSTSARGIRSRFLARPSRRAVAPSIALWACAGLAAGACRRAAHPVAAEAQFKGTVVGADSTAAAALALPNEEPAAPAEATSGYGYGGLAAIGKGASGGSLEYLRPRAAASHGARHSPHKGATGVRHSFAPVMAAAPEPTPRPPAPPPLDPNARYATTYRPGAAALGAFDAALARGTIPPVYRDLVGDFGARYAPALAAPDKGALVVQVDTERAAMAPAGGPLHLRVALRSNPGRELHRARLSVAVALDVSGSMRGVAIDNARTAAAALVRRLDDGDRFSLVTFSGDAQVLVAAGPVGPRRARILAKITTITAEGGTTSARASIWLTSKPGLTRLMATSCPS